MLRGKGVGMLPTLDEVIDAFPGKAFALDIKGDDRPTIPFVAEVLNKHTLATRRAIHWMGLQTDRQRAALLAVEGSRVVLPSVQQIKRCMKCFVTTGWFGYAPPVVNEPNVEITLHMADRASSSDATIGCPAMLATRKLVPGQPWLSGKAGIYSQSDGTVTFGFSAAIYSGTLPLGREDLLIGFVDCQGETDCPTTAYENANPCLWPPLPPSWVLVPEMQQDLNAFCSR